MKWIATAWGWLGDNHNQLSAFSSIVFGTSSAAIAWFAYKLSHQNNYGLKPLVLIPTLGGTFDKDIHYSTFKVEFWNRQKYDVDLRMLRASMKGVDTKGLLEKSQVWHNDWVLQSDGEFVQGVEITVPSGKSVRFDGKFPVKRPKGFEIPAVTVVYFDSVRGKTVGVKNRSLKWKRLIWRLRWARWKSRLMESLGRAPSGV